MTVPLLPDGESGAGRSQMNSPDLNFPDRVHWRWPWPAPVVIGFQGEATPRWRLAFCFDGEICFFVVSELSLSMKEADYCPPRGSPNCL
jgi:hypothetical protein